MARTKRHAGRVGEGLRLVKAAGVDITHRVHTFGAGGTTMELTKQHIEALRAFAQQHGKDWKRELLDQWMAGTDAALNKDGHLLRQVRNNLGPKWLLGVDLSSLPAA